MDRFPTPIRDLVFGDDGATMVEYGFLILLIAGICVGAVSLLGRQVAQMFVVPGL